MLNDVLGFQNVDDQNGGKFHKTEQTDHVDHYTLCLADLDLIEEEGKADSHGIHDLQQIWQQFGTGAIDQVHNMPDTKGHTGNNNGRFYAIPGHCLKQQAPENHFLKEADAEHREDIQHRFRQ